MRPEHDIYDSLNLKPTCDDDNCEDDEESESEDN